MPFCQGLDLESFQHFFGDSTMILFPYFIEMDATLFQMVYYAVLWYLLSFVHYLSALRKGRAAAVFRIMYPRCYDVGSAE